MWAVLLALWASVVVRPGFSPSQGLTSTLQTHAVFKRFNSANIAPPHFLRRLILPWAATISTFWCGVLLVRLLLLDVDVGGFNWGGLLLDRRLLFYFRGASPFFWGGGRDGDRRGGFPNFESAFIAELVAIVIYALIRLEEAVLC